MTQTVFDSSAWYRGLTLTERLESLRAVPQSAANLGAHAVRAGQRLQRWRSQLQFAAGSIFAQRLAMDGLTEEMLLRMLGESAETLRDRLPSPPAWLAELARAFSRPASDNSFPLPESLRDRMDAALAARDATGSIENVATPAVNLDAP